jgi:hypothetical protein
MYRQLKGSRSKSFHTHHIHDMVSHFLACREHANATDDEPLKSALLAYAAEQYVEILVAVGRSASAHRHLRSLWRHKDILASGLTPRVRKFVRASRLAGLGATVHAMRLRRAVWALQRL